MNSHKTKKRYYSTQISWKCNSYGNLPLVKLKKANNTMIPYQLYEINREKSINSKRNLQPEQISLNLNIHYYNSALNIMTKTKENKKIKLIHCFLEKNFKQQQIDNNPKSGLHLNILKCIKPKSILIPFISKYHSKRKHVKSSSVQTENDIYIL